MSLFTHNGRTILYAPPSKHPSYSHLPHHSQLSLSPSPPNRPLHLVSASKKFSSRTGRFDTKNRKNSTATKEDQDEQKEARIGDVENKVDDDGFVMPKLPGEEPDFWEGEQWDALGFFIQYMWAFGILFALIAAGFAVATYNEGATDFKETPVYKEAIQSQDFLEEPDESNSDVFESNPTEVAPSLE